MERDGKRLEKDWKKVEESVCGSVEVCIDLWRFMEVYGGLWRSVKVCEKFVKVFEDLWRSVEVCRGL